jgi:hypothetical protein
MGRKKIEGTTKVVKPHYVKKEKPKKVPVVLKPREKHECKWCKRIFSSERTCLVHLCEQKRRWEQKDTQYARYGLEAYFSIQNVLLRNDSKTEEDFRTSDFYLACVRWGRFVIDVDCLHPIDYLKWLIKNKVPIDHWNTDTAYSLWLQEIAFSENIWVAVDRSMNTMMDWAEENTLDFFNYFREAGGARILFDVQRGKISGILLFASESGKDWLHNLSTSDLEIIWPMIDSNKWGMKFQRDNSILPEVSQVCLEAGL